MKGRDSEKEFHINGFKFVVDIITIFKNFVFTV